MDKFYGVVGKGSAGNAEFKEFGNCAFPERDGFSRAFSKEEIFEGIGGEIRKCWESFFERFHAAFDMDKFVFGQFPGKMFSFF